MAKKQIIYRESRKAPDRAPSGFDGKSDVTFVHHVDSPSVNRAKAVFQSRSNGAIKAALTRKTFRDAKDNAETRQDPFGAEILTCQEARTGIPPQDTRWYRGDLIKARNTGHND